MFNKAAHQTIEHININTTRVSDIIFIDPEDSAYYIAPSIHARGDSDVFAVWEVDGMRQVDNGAPRVVLMEDGEAVRLDDVL